MGRQKGYTPEDYRRLAEMGMTKAEAAAFLGVSKQCVSFMAAQNEGIVFRRGKPGPRPKPGDGVIDAGQDQG